MTSKIANMVEYTGINDRLPTTLSTFSQFSLTKEICIPDQKLDIERVVRVDTKIQIKACKIIKTPIATSLEGQILTGNKLVVTGIIKQIIIYISKTAEQSVHSAHFCIPFCRYIVMPLSFVSTTPVTVVPYVEDVFVQKNNHRCLLSCITILLDTKFCITLNSQKNNNDCSSVKFIGIAPKLPENPIFFKELVLEENLTIPDLKPDMERIVSIATEVQIISSRIVDTSSAVSLEGQNLSGCKLILELKLNEIILYVANRITQPVHSAHFKSEMKSAFIVVPCEINSLDIQDLLQDGKLRITPYIEGVDAIMRDSRNIFKCITLLLDVTTRCNN